jgi:hypothetical protein
MSPINRVGLSCDSSVSRELKSILMRPTDAPHESHFVKVKVTDIRVHTNHLQTQSSTVVYYILFIYLSVVYFTTLFQ